MYISPCLTNCLCGSDEIESKCYWKCEGVGGGGVLQSNIPDPRCSQESAFLDRSPAHVQQFQQVFVD